MAEKAIQDYYPEDLSHCFGCGYSNERGHRLKSYWRDGVAVARFTPRDCHTAIPGYVYGGLLASLIDCHGTATAAAAAYRNEGREPGTEPPLRFVTASLSIDYLAPTPAGVDLELRGTPVEVKPRKVAVEIELHAAGIRRVAGHVIAVQLPDSMLPP